MKKTTLLKTVLLLCALIAGGSSAWADSKPWSCADPTSTLDLETVTSSNIGTFADEISYYLGDQYLVVSGYVSRTAPKPTWISHVEAGSSDNTWEASDPFKGSSYYTKAAYATLQAGRAIVYKVTNLKSLKVYGKNNSASKYLDIFIYTKSGDEYTKVEEITYTADTDNHIWENSVTLSPTETYYVYLTGVGKSNSRVYEVAFERNTGASSNVQFENYAPSISFPAQTTYTQHATTAPGYTGIVTYEITDNNAGATIEGATVTVASEGTVTVKATAPAVPGSFAASTATYTLTVNDTREENGLAFAKSTQEVAIGGILTAPALTNPNKLDVTYSSDDETIATVNATTGDVTGVAVGSTTIKATFAGNEEFKSGSASYTITVTKAKPANCILYETFDTNDKTGGNDGTWSDISTTPGPSFDNEGWTYDGYAASECVRTKKNGHFTTPALGFAGNATLTFKMASWGGDTNDGYVDILNGGTFEDGTSTQKKIAIQKSAWDTFTLELKNITAGTKIKFSDNGKGKRLFLDEVAIVATAAAVTITDAKYATYSGNYPLNFSTTDITPYTAKANGVGVTLYKIEDGIVPEGAGVVLYSETALTCAVPVASTAASDYSDLADENELIGIIEDTTVKKEGEAGKTNYILANESAGVGFYLATVGGAKLHANHAYLSTTATDTGAREFLGFGDGETTAIDGVKAASVENGAVYNLAGQRVAQPTKGLYIVNGKKYIVK